LLKINIRGSISPLEEFEEFPSFIPREEPVGTINALRHYCKYLADTFVYVSNLQSRSEGVCFFMLPSEKCLIIFSL
jgi:hypothetical protein